MSPVQDARVRLTRLLDEAKIELAALRNVVAELQENRAALGSPSPPKSVLAVVAVQLHRYYTALEAMLERVARLHDESVPQGPTSHRDLLEQMTNDLPPLRPAVLDRDLTRQLHRLLSFRHFFRHAYDVELDADELRRHTDNLNGFHATLVAALERFLAFVRATRDALPPSA